MPRVKKEESVKVEEKSAEIHGFYKGYDIKWLRESPSHPDYYLVEEFDSLNQKKGGD